MGLPFVLILIIEDTAQQGFSAIFYMQFIFDRKTFERPCSPVKERRLGMHHTVVIICSVLVLDVAELISVKFKAEGIVCMIAERSLVLHIALRLSAFPRLTQHNIAVRRFLTCRITVAFRRQRDIVPNETLCLKGLCFAAPGITFRSGGTFHLGAPIRKYGYIRQKQMPHQKK